MSMISAQVDELRGLAGDGSIEWVAGPIRASLLRDVADTLDESAKLRELVSLLCVIDKYIGICGDIDCNKCPVSSECAESVYLEGLLGIDAKETSWRVQWRIEDAMDIQTENKNLQTQLADATESTRRIEGQCAKLRELVRDWRDFAVGGADSLPDWNAQQADLESRMQKLGIEVE